MNSPILIDGKQVLLSYDGQLLTIGGEPLTLETLLKITEFVVTGSDLRGSESDAVDLRYKFVAVMSSLHRTEGRGTGASRYKAPHHLTMFGTGSVAPM